MNDQRLSRLRRKSDYYQHDAPDWARVVWPNPESFEWFCKSRRDKLTAAGAMLRIGRDWFVDSEIFPGAAKLVLGLPGEDEATPVRGQL